MRPTKRSVCSNRAATRGNLPKTQDNRQRRNRHFPKPFVVYSKLRQSIVPPSHGRGQAFKSPQAHTVAAYDLRLADELERRHRRPASDQHTERQLGRRVALKNRPRPPHERH